MVHDSMKSARSCHVTRPRNVCVAAVGEPESLLMLSLARAASSDPDCVHCQAGAGNGLLQHACAPMSRCNLLMMGARHAEPTWRVLPHI